MTKKRVITTAYLLTLIMLLTGCNYTPPYQRGYDEGYAAGLQAAGGEAPATDAAADNSAAQDTAAQDSGAATPQPEKSASPLSSLLSSKSDDTGDDADDSGDAEDTEDNGEDDDGSDDVSAEETGDGSEEDASEAEVLGEGPSQQGGGGGIPSGRIIAAEAVNEALYTNPEVIDGLRELYPDTAIFGEYVGDSETNLLHRVGSDHFNQLGYDTIVVFDGSKSLQDILNEGFFTQCDCIN